MNELRVYRRTTSMHFHYKTTITAAYKNPSTCNNKLLHQT